MGRILDEISIIADIKSRIVNIGRPEHSLLIPNPGVDVVLPGNDEEWDQGVSLQSGCVINIY